MLVNECIKFREYKIAIDEARILTTKTQQKLQYKNRVLFVCIGTYSHINLSYLERKEIELQSIAV